MIRGRVIKILSDRFAVAIPSGTVEVKSRKKIKREVLPVAGDSVLLEKVAEEYVLAAIEPRVNRLIRPPIANVDCIVITVAPVPEPDFVVVDKMIVSARKAGIRTAVCVNKTDIVPDGFTARIFAQYSGVADEVLCVSASRGDTAELQKLLRGKFSCLAGQSAVGKTSLVNRICGVNREVGELSEKILRGKNTTVGVELIRTEPDTYVADTPGFGALDLSGVEPSDLHLYYEEYVSLSEKCKYRMCTHTVEPDCAVRAAVQDGKLNEERYDRYCLIYKELKDKNGRKTWRTTYEK